MNEPRKKLELPGVTAETPLTEVFRKAFAESWRTLGREPRFMNIRLTDDDGVTRHHQFIFN